MERIPVAGIDQAGITAGLRIHWGIDLALTAGFGMAIGEGNIAGAGKAATIVAAGIHPFVLAGRAGSGHTGFAPPQTPAGRQSRPALIIGFGLLVTIDQAIRGPAHIGAFKVISRGEVIAPYGNGFDRIGGAIQKKGIIAITHEIEIEGPSPGGFVVAHLPDQSGIVKRLIQVRTPPANGRPPPLIRQTCVRRREPLRRFIRVNLGIKHHLLQIIQTTDLDRLALGGSQRR